MARRSNDCFAARLWNEAALTVWLTDESEMVNRTSSSTLSDAISSICSKFFQHFHSVRVLRFQLKQPLIVFNGKLDVAVHHV